MKPIPLFDLTRESKQIKESVLLVWSDLIEKTQFTSGKEIDEFEKNFSQFCEARGAVGVSSGTSALLIALKTLGVGPGDEVITTPFTFTATADAISFLHAKPVFVDVLPESGNIDHSQIESKINAKTKAILVVHLYGVPCEMDSILETANKYKIFVIEDASHAHGSTYRGRSVGSLGDISCFSLYPSKNLGAYGNAGVIVSTETALLKKARMFAHHGIRDKSKKYNHEVIGINELMDNMQAAVLNIKLKTFAEKIERRKAIANHFNQTFHRYGHLGMFWPEDTDPTPYIYSVFVTDRDLFISLFKDHRIETGVYYPIPLHLQKSYQYLNYASGDFPVAESLSQRTVSIPSFSELEDSEIESINQALEKYLKLAK